MDKKISPVKNYMDKQPAAVRALLQKVRTTIRKAAPEAEESVSYGLPAYKYLGKPLVYFGAWKSHIGFYALPSGNAAFKKELSKYKNAKGSIQFPLDLPMPLALIGRMVKHNAKEIAAAAKAPKKKQAAS